MALDSLTSALLMQLGWTAQKNITGTDYAPISNATTVKKSSSVGTAVANNAAGGGNVLASFIVSVPAASAATVDLTSLTEITGATGVSLARVKGLFIRLLSVEDDATNGTAASSVTIGNAATNAWTSQGESGWLGDATSTIDIPNGGAVGFCTPNATGVLVDATHKSILITNNDALVAAKVQITLQGGST